MLFVSTLLKVVPHMHVLDQQTASGASNRLSGLKWLDSDLHEAQNTEADCNQSCDQASRDAYVCLSVKKTS